MDKQEINNAISEHAMWKFNLNNLIQNGKLELPVYEFKDNECEFGKWFYGPTVGTGQRSSAHYKRVQELHVEFHEVAAKVANLASKGDKDAAERLMDLEGEFTTISNRLIQALMKWKDIV